MPVAWEDSLRCEVCTCEDVSHLVARGEVVKPSKERVILRDVLVGHSCAQVCQLQLAHVLLVHGERMQFVPAVLDDALDVLDGQLAVPTTVNMDHQRS